MNFLYAIALWFLLYGVLRYSAKHFRRARYRALLRDPRWLERRAQYFEHHARRCQQCGSPRVTLHHLYYLPGHKPWEYPDSALVALCWPHHQDQHRLWR